MVDVPAEKVHEEYQLRLKGKSDTLCEALEEYVKN
jgi:hypothetical protein